MQKTELTKKRTAHRQVTVENVTWMMNLDGEGNLTMRKRHARRGVTIRADELARKAEQLYEGSLALYIDAPKTPAMTVESGGGDLRDEKNKSLEQEVIEFILWLTPCGQCKPAPSHKEIGKWARRINKRMLQERLR